MKKQLLMITAVAVTLTVSAQNRKMYTGPSAKRPVKNVVEPVSQGAAKASTPSGKKAGGNSVNAVVQLSMGPNALGTGFGAKTAVWADPSINAIAFTHRNTGVFPSSGDINVDYSTDGGATWTLNQNVYLSSGAPATPPSIARYPNGAIYNPVGNTVASNAYAAFTGPTRDGSNPSAGGGDWGGFGYGSTQLMAGAGQTQNEITTDAANGYYRHYPDGFMVCKTGEAYALTEAIDWSASATTGNFILDKGAWGTGGYNYTSSLIPIPSDPNVGVADYDIAFADNGLTGYIVALTNDDVALRVDSVLYPVVYKTLDGGTTWTGPIRIDLYNNDAGIDSLGAGSGVAITTGFEVDATVDGNGNLHFICCVAASAGGFSIATAPGFMVMSDIFTTDGGTSWYAVNVGSPQTFRGTFGDGSTVNVTIEDDQRPQISRSYDGTKVMLTWFDTDPNNFAGLGNTYPDAWSAGIDFTSNLKTASANRTASSSANAQCMMGNVSYYLMDNAGTLTAPFTYQVISGSTATGEPLNTGGPVEYYYSSDDFVTPADFTLPANAIPLNVLQGINDVQTIKASSIALTPNPANGSTKLSYLLNSSSDVSIKVVNLIGATVTSLVQPAQTAGLHEVQLNLTDLKAGVYFVNVSAKGSVSTSKLIIK